MQDEILVKGTDGKWYILKGEELLPYGEQLQEVTGGYKRLQEVAELPKGVSAMAHERLEEKAKPQKIEAQKLNTDNTELTKSSVRSVSTSSVVSHEEHPLKVELEELVDKVLQEVTKKLQEVTRGYFEDTVLKKRFRTIVSARLREVRDAPETREMLIRPQKVGGMGMGDQGSGNQVAGVMDVIERAFFEFQRKWKEAEEKRRQEWIKVQERERAKKQAGAEKREEEELEKRYQRLTGAVPPATKAELGTGLRKAELPPVPEQSSVRGLAIPKEIPKPKVQIQKTTAQAAPAPSIASTPPKPLLMPPPPMVVKTQGGGATPPSPPLPKERKESGMLLHKGGEEKKLTDVRRVPKLVGPIEELSSLSLVDFRRIAVSPKEGAEKIAAKIDRLVQESLARKTQGIAAWRRSPLYQEYARVMRRALSEGIAPAEAIGKGTEAASGAALTKEEWYAIMELNQKLRF